jgi:hypothetical protein
MAISIPIVTELNAKGIDRAVREFKNLETAGQKAQFAISKAAVPATAALGFLAVAGGDAVKAFMEDDLAAQGLAVTLKNVTYATDEQVKAVEEFITKTSVAAAVADDELRPAMDKLVRGTGDVTQAQDLLNLALDISAGTGKDLGAVSDALSKAYNGQLGPLKKLDPALAQLIEQGGDTDEVFGRLASTFKGQASTAANTASGKMKSFSIQMGEFKESIGAAILPIVQKLLPGLQAFGTWISNNVPLVVTLGAVIGGIAAAVVLTNAAMAAWNALTIITAAVNAVLATSFSALWVATGAVVIIGIIAALVALQVKFDIFGKAIDGIKVGFNAVWGAIKTVFNWAKDNWPLLLAIITGPFGLAIAFVVKFRDDIMNMFSLIYSGIKATMGFVADVISAPFKLAFKAVASLWNNTIGKLSFTVPSWVPGLGGKGFDVPDIPMLAEGGIVNSATLAMIGESGPEAVIPLSKLGSMGGGSNITVNVTSANPDDVVAALQRWVRNNGSLALATTAGVRF